jgi:Ca2+-binding RTX toxin-like protein
MRRRLRTAAVILVTTVALAAFGAAPAGATTNVSVNGNRLLIGTGLTDSNNITVTKVSGSEAIVREQGTAAPRVAAGSGCTQAGDHQANCSHDQFGGSVEAGLRGGVDFYSARNLLIPQEVAGDFGQKTIATGSARDTLRGGSGADSLDGGPNTDFLYGGSGNDSLMGGSGGDFLRGGPGRDEAQYAVVFASDVNHRVSLDLRIGSATVAGDFADSISEVEGALGSRLDDTLIGTEGDNTLRGESPIFSSPSGNKDTLTGLGGNDFIDAGQNRARDTVSCGAGNDSILLDLTDVPPGDPALNDCESIEQTAVDQHPAVTIRGRRAKLAGRTILVPLSCSRKSRRRCSGRLSVRRRGGARLGRPMRYRLGRGRGRTVRVPLSRTGQGLVARPGRLRVEVTARERDPKGRPKVKVARFKLRGS